MRKEGGFPRIRGMRRRLRDCVDRSRKCVTVGVKVQRSESRGQSNKALSPVHGPVGGVEWVVFCSFGGRQFFFSSSRGT